MRGAEEPSHHSSPLPFGLPPGQSFRPSSGAAVTDARSRHSNLEELTTMASTDQERLNRIRQSLAGGGLDALLLLFPDDILMATGMLPASTHVAVLVDRDGGVSLLTPWWRESFVAEESWADRVDCFDWCKRGCQVDPDRAVIEWLRDQRAGQGIETVGAHLEVHHYGPNKMPSECLTYDRIRAAMPSIFPVVEDAGERINQLKSVKTSREIGKLKQAHQVARAGAETFYQLAQAGIREIDLATEVHCAVLRKAASLGIDYVFCEMPQITSGPERTGIADTLSNHPTARQLQQGDPVLLELGVHAEGYWADITRATVVGEPTELLRRLHQAVLDAQTAAIARYVPGESTGEQLCEASWQAMREAGFEQGITHFLGHGLGFAYHEDRPTLGPGEQRPVMPGQVTSIEPGLYWREGSQPVGGIRVEENVVWGSRAGEVEILSDYYRGLDRQGGDF